VILALRRRVVLAGIVLALGGLVIILWATEGKAVPPRTCDSDGLQISTTPTGGAAGHNYQTFVIVNLRRSACELKGYPHIRLYGDQGQVVNARVAHVTGIFSSPAAKVVLLPGGGVASFGFVYATAVHVSGAGRAICQVRSLTVAMPDHTSSADAFAFLEPFNLCRSGGAVGITPIERGPRPS